MTELLSGCLAQEGPGAPPLRRVVLAGNTVMQHLFAGLPVASIAAAPFAPLSLFDGDTGDRLLGAPLYYAPCVAGYVGGDITAGLLASGLWQRPGQHLFLDLGTNGEMALLSGGTIYCCATAAGPAFEGVGISCGSGAVPGAIDAVTADGDALRVRVIGGGRARSLCGSGLLDAVAALRQLERVEDSGFTEEDALPLAPGVTLLRRDIRAFQLAKSAICAGAETLLHTAENGRAHV